MNSGEAAALLGNSTFLTATWAAALVLAYLLVVAACTLGRLKLYRRPADSPLIVDDGPSLGDQVPSAVLVALEGVTGRPIASGGRRSVVLFMSPTCSPCDDLLDDLKRVGDKWRGEADVIVVLDTGGISDRHPSMARWSRPSLLTLRDEAGAWSQLLEIRHRPMAFLLDGGGVVRMKGVVSTSRHVDALLQGWGVTASGRQWSEVESPGAVGSHALQSGEMA